MYYPRKLENEVLQSLENNPVTAIIGPRQCGKSTLARYIAGKTGKAYIFLDLERPSDLHRLDEAEWFLEAQKEKLICLDEIQRKPGLFPLIRSLVDHWGGNGHFLVLGSASRELLTQSSESLAGRIAYKNLTPFLFTEIQDHVSVETFLSRGGFPRSILAASDRQSFDWREDFITTFLERDLLFWAGFSVLTMRRLWQMLANLNGQMVNYSAMAAALGVSNTSVKNYIDLLGSTFMLKLLTPCRSNIGKRLVKTPKVYLSDTGMVNALIRIADFEQLAGHPSFGSAWESMVVNHLIAVFPHYEFSFYRTNHGAEIDLVVDTGHKRFAVECKASLSPRLSAGNHSALRDLKPDATFMVSPVRQGWPMQKDFNVVSLQECVAMLS